MGITVYMPYNKREIVMGKKIVNSMLCVTMVGASMVGVEELSAQQLPENGTSSTSFSQANEDRMNSAFDTASYVADNSFTQESFLVSDASTFGLPQDYADFKQRCQSMLKTPEGAVKMYFDAVFCYMDPNKRAEAQKMLRYVMHESAGWDRKSTFETFVSRLRNPSKHHIFYSYARGTSPENGYSMSVDNYTLNVVKIRKESDYTKVMLQSSGADSPRPIWVQLFDDGKWYVTNNASSYVGVREPKVGADNSHDADYD